MNIRMIKPSRWLGLALAVCVPAYVWAAPGPEVALDVVSIDQEQAVVELAGHGMENVGGFEFELVLSGQAARVRGAQLEVDFLGQAGRTAQPLGPYMDADGTSLAAGGYSYGSPASGADGNQALAQITLTLDQAGLSRLSLEEMTLVAPDATILLSTTQEHALQVSDLVIGWNLLSACIDPGSQPLSATLQGIAGQYDQVVAQDNSAPAGLDAGAAYWLRSTAGASSRLGMLGAPYAPTTTLALEPGWHWIGYCLEESQPVTAAMASMTGKYDRVVGDAGAYAPALSPLYQSLWAMDFGQGYLVHVTEAGTLQYPQMTESSQAQPSNTCQTPVAPTPYSSLLYGTVRVDGELAPAGSVVEVLTPRHEVAGCFRLGTSGLYGLANVYGADSDGAIAGFRDGEPLALRVNGCVPVTSSLSWADDKTPHELHVSVVDGVCHLEILEHVYLPLVLKTL
ncbi:MAG: hypothetical protein JW850_03865 [Thermoflexales bacterium]|nr:hypothetical protein [Thermoflexales bacterium]